MPLFDLKLVKKNLPRAASGNFKLAALVPNECGFCLMHVTAG
jgi:hypothetical protein